MFSTLGLFIFTNFISYVYSDSHECLYDDDYYYYDDIYLSRDEEYLFTALLSMMLIVIIFIFMLIGYIKICETYFDDDW